LASEQRSRRTARHAAMDLLARREHSQLELSRKLRSRDYSPEEITEALTGLAADGLQDDGRFIESFVNSRLARGQGPLRIRADLRQRGIAEALVESHLAAAAIDWIAAAREARQRRFGATRPADFQERARQARFLAGRGFSQEQIQRAMGADDHDS